MPAVPEKTGTALDDYQMGCKPACLRYTYRPSITAAQWPTKKFLTWIATKVGFIIIKKENVILYLLLQGDFVLH